MDKVKEKLKNIKVEKIMQLDKSKVYLFHFNDMPTDNLVEIRNALIEKGFREDCIFIKCEKLNIYEMV